MRRSVLLACSMSLLAGCGGGADNDAAGVATPSAASSTAPTESVTPSAPSSSAPPSSAPSSDTAGDPPADAAAVCTFLAAEVKRLNVGTAIGNLAQFTGDPFTFVSDHPAARFADTSALDTATASRCPAARTAILKKIGADAFAGSL